MEGLSTGENSPGIINHTPRNRRTTKSLSILQNLHTIQCSCEYEERNLLTRSYMQLFQRNRTTSCRRAQEWLRRCRVPSDSDTLFREISSSMCENDKSFLDSQRQIELDIGRTYPDEAYFAETSPGQAALRRVLIAFSKYDTHLGYVQGMNFIAGALLWHATEEDAFWLLVGLMEDYEMRDNYLPRLPGLSKHCQIIHLLILDKFRDLHNHFAEYKIINEMYATEWCLTLFGSIVPVQDMVVILNRFFTEGWSFFYKLVLVILRRLEDRIISTKDPVDILSPLKPAHRSQKEWRHFITLLEKGNERLNWRSFVEKTNEEYIDENYIRQLHRDFDIETGQFKITAVKYAKD